MKFQKGRVQSKFRYLIFRYFLIIAQTREFPTISIKTSMESEVVTATLPMMMER